jgi:hypothetical protein
MRSIRLYLCAFGSNVRRRAIGSGKTIVELARGGLALQSVLGRELNPARIKQRRNKKH